MTDSRFFLDSSAWLAYFLGASGKIVDVMDSDSHSLFTSALCLHEVSKRLKNMGKTPKQVDSAVEFIRENSIVISVDEEVALKSVNHCLEKNLHTVDSLIYESSIQNHCTLVTFDYDFKGLDDAIILT